MADVETVILPFPGSELVSHTEEDKIGTHQLITGSVERVNTKYLPEASEYVKGRKQTGTYQVFNARSTAVVGGFFREQLVKQGDILFECSGRSCGSSTYWANSLFKRYLLYGPEQYQQYYVAKLVNGGTYYVTVYVVQRATGKMYAHIEVISVAGVPANGKGGRDVGSEIKLKGKFVFDLNADDQMLNAIHESITSSDVRQFALVGHDELRGDETVEAAIDRTREMAEKIRARLLGKGVAATRLTAFGAGPLAPMDRRGKRIELVVLRR